MRIRLVAIDPGKSAGGIALKDEAGAVTAYKMPETVQEIQDFFTDLDKTKDCQCVIEQLHAGSVVQGPRKSAKTIWSQSSNYTALMCGLYNANIPVLEASPVKWMKFIPGTRPRDYALRKKFFKAYAIKRFPAIKVTNWAADALCIMDISNNIIKG